MIARRVRIRGLDSSKISRDESVQQAYASDPLIPPTASLRLIVEFAKACEEARMAATRISMPTLVVHGGSRFIELVVQWLLTHIKNGFNRLPLPRATGEG